MKKIIYLIIIFVLSASCEQGISIDLNNLTSPKNPVGGLAGKEEGPEEDSGEEEVPVSSSYRLDAQSAEFGAFSGTALSMSADFLEGSHTMTGATFNGYGMPKNFMESYAQKLDFSSGKRAIECDFSYVTPAASGNLHSYICGVADIHSNRGFYYQVAVSDAGIFGHVLIDGNIVLAESFTSISEAPKRVGFEVDAATQSLKVYLDNNEKNLTSNTITTQAYLGVIYINETEENSGNIGKTAVVRLIPAMDQMTTSYSPEVTQAPVIGGELASSEGAGLYPLDATYSEITAFSPSATNLVMSDNFSTADHIMTGSTFYGVALPKDFQDTPATLNFTTGKKAFECDFSGENADASGSSEALSYLMMCGVVNLASSQQILSYNAVMADGSVVFQITNESGFIYSERFASLSVAPKRVAFVLDATTQTMRVYFDGIEKTLSSNSYTPEEMIGAIQINENTDNSLNAGKNIKIRFIVDGQLMTTGFENGTTDPFGNPVAVMVL